MQFNSQDKEYAEYIKDSYVLWIEIKRQLAPIIDVIAKDGKIPSKESGDRNYFG